MAQSRTHLDFGSAFWKEEQTSVFVKVDFGRKKTMTQIRTLLVDSGRECDEEE